MHLGEQNQLVSLVIIVIYKVPERGPQNNLKLSSFYVEMDGGGEPFPLHLASLVSQTPT
jgi:hypothetical protein